MIFARLLSCLFSVAILAAQPVTAPDQDTLRLESRRRHEALIKDGYNLTYGFTLGDSGHPTPIHLELLVPETPAEHRISLWVETRAGEAAVRIVDKTGRVLLSWAGHKGEMLLSRRIPTGKYLLEIDSAKASGGYAQFGVKGALMQVCPLESVQCQEHAATPAEGFRWPYLLYRPKEIRFPSLLVVPNNTGFATVDLELLRASAFCEIEAQSALAERLGCPLLVPLFPRPPLPGFEENLYLHALSRAALQATPESWRRVDLQLLGMIRDAQRHLQFGGTEMTDKVLLSGFSASGSFVNRFAMIHPERVLAVACGSPGGWPLAPVANLDGHELPYPVGISDLPILTDRPVGWDALRQVPWLFFQGEQDVNDAVPFRDSFSKADEEQIFRCFGTTPVSRWKRAEELYARQGLRARFVLYPGVGHSIPPKIQEDIARFFEERLISTHGQPELSDSRSKRGGGLK